MRTFELDDSLEDSVVTLRTLIKLAQDGDQATCKTLSHLHKEALKTPQGKSIEQRLPHLKETLQPSRPHSDHYLDFVVKCLSEQVSADCRQGNT